MLQYWKQFLYVSLLMVLVGPLRDPFFLRKKPSTVKGVHSMPRPIAAVEDYIVWVGRSEVSDPARWFSILAFAAASCSLNCTPIPAVRLP